MMAQEKGKKNLPRVTLGLMVVGVLPEPKRPKDWKKIIGDDRSCSRAASSSGREQKEIAAEPIWQTSVKVQAWGVLGDQTKVNGNWVRKVSVPKSDAVIVDLAGLRYIQEVGPRGAQGVAGAIYSYVGICENKEFPAEVKQG